MTKELRLGHLDPATSRCKAAVTLLPRARPAEPASYPAGSRGVIRLNGQPLKLNVRHAWPPQTSVSAPLGWNQSDFCWRAAGVLRGNECGSAPPRFGVFVTGGSGVWLPPSQ